MKKLILISAFLLCGCSHFQKPGEVLHDLATEICQVQCETMTQAELGGLTVEEYCSIYKNLEFYIDYISKEAKRVGR